MKVATIIVSHNGAAWIRGALQSLRESSHPSQVIVVDNASGDDTLAIVRGEFPEVRLIESPRNLGFGRGNNLGLARALQDGAELTLLLNQDAFVTPTAIGDMVAFLGRHPEFGVVSPLHCSPDLGHVDAQTLRGYLQPYAAHFISDACLGKIASYYEVRGINAAAWGVRAEVWASVGGFDPLYFMYGEDNDLIERFAHHGVRTALLPATQIVHLRAKAGPSSPDWLARLRQRHQRARAYLLLELKLPRGIWPGKLMRLLGQGFLAPALDLINHHSLSRVLAHWLATLELLVQLGRVRRHVNLCRVRGAHFLPRSGEGQS